MLYEILYVVFYCGWMPGRAAATLVSANRDQNKVIKTCNFGILKKKSFDFKYSETSQAEGENEQVISTDTMNVHDTKASILGKMIFFL